jgi:hypothetical protein
MKRSVRRIAALSALLALVVGCAASERTFASRRDYWAYRQFRLADTTLEALRQSNRYLKDLPEGRFRPEVAAWFAKHEPAFYRAALDRPSLLRAYLAALPDGPNAERVIDRLVELEALREYRAKQLQRQEHAIGRIGQELSRAQEQREAVVLALTDFIRLLADVRSFGRPTEQLNHELLFRLRLSKPSMRCDAEACTKSVRLPYAIPEAKQLVLREAVFDVELRLERGLLRAATLRGPELFSRLAEASSLTPVQASDFASRLDAIAKVTALVENTLEPRFPAASCAREVVAPVILRRDCDGIALELTAGGEPGAADLLVVRPAPSAATPPK